MSCSGISATVDFSSTRLDVSAGLDSTGLDSAVVTRVYVSGFAVTAISTGLTIPSVSAVPSISSVPSIPAVPSISAVPSVPSVSAVSTQTKTQCKSQA